MYIGRYRMWPISITETGNHADIDIDHSIFPDTLPPSPPLPRNNIVPWMKKQAGSCVKNPSVQTWITVENEKKSGMIVSRFLVLSTHLLHLQRRVFHFSSFFLLLFCERIFRLINTLRGKRRAKKRRKEGRK